MERVKFGKTEWGHVLAVVLSVFCTAAMLVSGHYAVRLAGIFVFVNIH